MARNSPEYVDITVMEDGSTPLSKEQIAIIQINKRVKILTYALTFLAADVMILTYFIVKIGALL